MGVYRGVTQDNVTINNGNARLQTLTLTSDLKIPSATVVAAGANQGAAVAIKSGFTLVTSTGNNQGVKLPAASAGLVAIVKNSSANTLKVYPNTDDKINAGAANAALDLATNTSAVLVAYDSETWYSVPLLPS
jgi:hypothetical protein